MSDCWSEPPDWWLDHDADDVETPDDDPFRPGNPGPHPTDIGEHP